jgi:radical SAM superfamily enzyme YgiQ (UPF0313 family)
MSRDTITIMKTLLISTYELGRQPFGIASPAAFLRAAGVEVRCLDLAIQRLDAGAVRWADVVCFYLPMHTATRMAVQLTARVKAVNPNAHLCYYGLYAPVNEPLLRSIGAGTVLGGEFEHGLIEMVERLRRDHDGLPISRQESPAISMERIAFRVPDRQGLPELSRYAHVAMPDGTSRVAGYTEATRGCKHRCRHCPIVPVYGGTFRAVPRDVVLADIAQQVAAGAEHVTFGDPDFLNGPGHVRRIVEELHRRWPELTYDATIKVEHLIRHADVLPLLRNTGCILITTAVESIDERILHILDKRHTREDFERAVRLTADAGIAINPTFVAFTPWTTLGVYVELMSAIAGMGLIDNVAPVQLAIRLLIPAGSRLLELEETRTVIGPFDPLALVYPWRNPDARMDHLQESVMSIVQQGVRDRSTRTEIFEHVWNATLALAGRADVKLPVRRTADGFGLPPVPQLSEPWYC